MYKNCREELLAVMRAFVIETGENEFSRAEAIAAIFNIVSAEIEKLIH